MPQVTRVQLGDVGYVKKYWLCLVRWLLLVYNGYDYIRIGLALRNLRHVDSEFTKEDVTSNLDDLFENLGQGSFQVSLAYKNSRIFKRMEEELSALSYNDKLNDDLCWLVEHVTSSLENIIFAESFTKKIYVLPDRRYNADYLLNNPDKLLKEGTFEKLGTTAQKDVTSACKCLLFGEATAAAFHNFKGYGSCTKELLLHT